VYFSSLGIVGFHGAAEKMWEDDPGSVDWYVNG
jgi:hypothetical protein